MSEIDILEHALVSEIKQLIASAQQRAAAVVNAEITLLYWQIGHRVFQESLKGGRAEYGEEVIALLGRSLTSEFGRGFGPRNLRRMVKFVEVFPDLGIVTTLSMCIFSLCATFEISGLRQCITEN